MKNLSVFIRKGFARRGALIAQAAGLCLVSSTALAAVIESTVNVSVTNSIDGVYMNLVTGVTGASGTAVPNWDIDPYNNGAGLTFYGAASPQGIVATGTPGTNAVATNLAPGDVISSCLQFNQFQTTGPQFQNTSVGYVGVRFNNESTGALNYGYMKLNTTPGTGFPATVVFYAYENTGGPITIPLEDRLFADNFEGTGC